MSYVDQDRLGLDSGFRSQVRIAILTQALTVQGEAQGVMSDSVLDKRQALATSILANPDGQLDRWAKALATQAGSLAAPVSIASSTAANPTVVTTASAHGFAVGDVVEIVNSQGNTTINGTWPVVTVPTSTTFSINVASSTAGTAGGTVQKLPPDSAVLSKVQSLWNSMAGIRSTD